VRASTNGKNAKTIPAASCSATTLVRRQLVDHGSEVVITPFDRTRESTRRKNRLRAQPTTRRRLHACWHKRAAIQGRFRKASESR